MKIMVKGITITAITIEIKFYGKTPYSLNFTFKRAAFEV